MIDGADVGQALELLDFRLHKFAVGNLNKKPIDQNQEADLHIRAPASIVTLGTPSISNGPSFIHDSRVWPLLLYTCP